jgi:hypothetical protein
MNIRKAFEHGFAGLIFCSTLVLVFGGTLAVCFPGAGLVA